MPVWRERMQALWFHPALSPKLWLLLPVEGLFAVLAAGRRLAYRSRFLRSCAVGRPVVVVGNILVGGTGKTPLVIWLTDHLRQSGRRPGIVARGVGGDGRVQAVSANSDPRQVGDEPVLLAARCAAPVFVGRDRVAAAQALLAANPEVDTLICDDGLQHYRLRRDVEIAVVDGRRFGNGHLLPVGPLREPVARLRSVDAVVVNGAAGAVMEMASVTPTFKMSLVAERVFGLDDPGLSYPLGELAGRDLCVIAGIGDPQRFFGTLQRCGLAFEARAFPDHHAYTKPDLDFARGRVLLMTEKDAVKCRGLFAGEAWFLPVAAQLEPDLAAFVLEKLHGCQTA